MATDKTSVEASTHKARQPGVMAFGHIGPTVGGTLESTVLAMLSSARTATRHRATLNKSLAARSALFWALP